MTDDARRADRPASFGEVFRVREFRAIFTANSLSWWGDYVAKAAVAALVFQTTRSIGLAGATFALSYLPWLVGGPLLTALADRVPYRRVMILCDLARMVTMALVAIPGIPIPLMLLLLFLTSLATPPAQAARSATLPEILNRDQLVVGIALASTFGQVMQIAGYVAGGLLSSVAAREAIVLNAATFGLSALIIWRGVRLRPAAPQERRHLLRETAAGFRLVFGRPTLRAIALVVFGTALFSVVPEGLAPGWAGHLSADATGYGVAQSVIMAANPIGFVIGSLVVTRTLRPHLRETLVPVFAVLTPACLVPALIDPSLTWVAVMTLLCGFATAALLPTANGLFVQMLPPAYRARAFGVMQTGLQASQGLGVLITSALAESYALPRVVGLWGLAGVGLLLLAAAVWPSREMFARAIAATTATADAPAPAAGRRVRTRAAA
ncbi:MFS transporter [Pilimelia terevasa]|uniref:MFS transporter n=1 Tax=Pilimelia terevasa TaxID=53372 RepID=A0A8J3BTF8_9ACTN|nr:MFS transporter [Pilimelia terevasa]GGK38284.1 MFS transporter [Pilimelia terevasa]